MGAAGGVNEANGSFAGDSWAGGVFIENSWVNSPGPDDAAGVELAGALGNTESEFKGALGIGAELGACCAWNIFVNSPGASPFAGSPNGEAVGVLVALGALGGGDTRHSFPAVRPAPGPRSAGSGPVSFVPEKICVNGPGA